jgi:hypothetical protein
MEFIFTSLILFNQLFIIENALNELNRLYGIRPNIVEINNNMMYNGLLRTDKHTNTVTLALNLELHPPIIDSVCGGKLYYEYYEKYLKCLVLHEYGHLFLNTNLLYINNLNFPDLTGDSSIYASYNSHEAFAEAFAEFHMYKQKQCYSTDCIIVKYIIETLY